MQETVWIAILPFSRSATPETVLKHPLKTIPDSLTVPKKKCPYIYPRLRTCHLKEKSGALFKYLGPFPAIQTSKQYLWRGEKRHLKHKWHFLVSESFPKAVGNLRRPSPSNSYLVNLPSYRGVKGYVLQTGTEMVSGCLPLVIARRLCTWRSIQ